MVNIEQIKEKLSDAIKNSDMTQKDLAKAIGVCQQAISQYRNKEILPTLDKLANLCAVLGLDANDILCVDTYNLIGQ